MCPYVKSKKEQKNKNEQKDFLLYYNFKNWLKNA